MSTLALIGSGDMGGTVARLAVAAGLDVVLSNSRGPQTLSGLVDELGTRATAATVEDAARAGDWVVLALPFSAFRGSRSSRWPARPCSRPPTTSAAAATWLPSRPPAVNSCSVALRAPAS